LKYKEDEELPQIYRRFLNLSPSMQEEVLNLYNTMQAARVIKKPITTDDLTLKQISLKEILYYYNWCGLGI